MCEDTQITFTIDFNVSSGDAPDIFPLQVSFKPQAEECLAPGMIPCYPKGKLLPIMLAPAGDERPAITTSHKKPVKASPKHSHHQGGVCPRLARALEPPPSREELLRSRPQRRPQRAELPSALPRRSVSRIPCGDPSFDMGRPQLAPAYPQRVPSSSRIPCRTPSRTGRPQSPRVQSQQMGGPQFAPQRVPSSSRIPCPIPSRTERPQSPRIQSQQMGGPQFGPQRSRSRIPCPVPSRTERPQSPRIQPQQMGGPQFTPVCTQRVPSRSRIPCPTSSRAEHTHSGSGIPQFESPEILHPAPCPQQTFTSSQIFPHDSRCSFSGGTQESSPASCTPTWHSSEAPHSSQPNTSACSSDFSAKKPRAASTPIREGGLPSPNMSEIKESVVVDGELRRIVAELVRQLQEEMNELEDIKDDIYGALDFEASRDWSWMKDYQTDKERMMYSLELCLEKLVEILRILSRHQSEEFHKLYSMPRIIEPFLASLVEVVTRDYNLIEKIFEEMQDLSNCLDLLDDAQKITVGRFVSAVGYFAKLFSENAPRLVRYLAMEDEPSVCVFLVHEGEKILDQLRGVTEVVKHAYPAINEIHGELFVSSGDSRLQSRSGTFDVPHHDGTFSMSHLEETCDESQQRSAALNSDVTHNRSQKLWHQCHNTIF